MIKIGAFTLIELLIVIAIVAILAGAMVPMIRTSRQDAEIAKAYKDMEAIKTACHLMHLDTGTWPRFYRPTTPVISSTWTAIGIMNNQDYQGDSVSDWDGPYLDEWRVDPWGNPYYLVYCWPTTTYTYFYVVSGGPDGNILMGGGNCGPNGLTSINDILLLIVRINL